MPFQSEKQRRFLHANHPEIAKRWERDYANGGILDINESEEIISDDGNDIELTAYNAEFDDPKDLSTGVKTLFQAKDGGTPRRRYFTGAYGGGNPNEDRAAEESRASRGPRDDPDRFGSPPETKTTSPKDDEYKSLDLEEQAVVDKQKDDLRETVNTWEEKWGKYDSPFDKYSFNKVGVDKRKALDEKLYNDRKVELEKKIISTLVRKGFKHLFNISSFGLSDFVDFDPTTLKVTGIYADVMTLEDLKKEYLSKLEGYKENYRDLGVPEYHPHIDTVIQTIDQEILDLTKTKDEDDTKGGDPELPEVVPIGEEIEAYAQTPPRKSSWEQIKSNQARKAMLVAEGIHEDVP